MVVSDRISTYDVVHPTPVPNKGKMLPPGSPTSGWSAPARSCPTT